MIIVIVGPTGVGKTKLSIDLAKIYNAEIINADAMQVYKGLNIGTAKIKEEEKEGIKHHLIDFVDVKDSYSVFDYQNDGRRIIKRLQQDNKNIVIVGGSALYIKALLYDYNFYSKGIDNNYDDVDTEILYDRLKRLDKNVKIDKNNRRRIVRAINYYLENKSSISDNKNGEVLLYKDAIFIGLTTDRDKLYENINKRVDKMITSGLLEEVKYFYDNNLVTKPLETGIGYKEVISYFNGLVSRDEMIELIKKNSRHYAKRQYTFMRNKMDIKWFLVDFDNFDNTVLEVKKYIDNFV